ncbi:MAG: hypothetical protein DLM65_15330 [Candidatus Aeolococcus gillhamiae]|uniref:Mycothiol-dependent maleylpyruvate isomerase metal-binding domain-containing protein n=1 Tax=Candidatus Aeolococcus gillhamiae TaxID=3127015 RepID=A0A2W6AIQ7_9BACT|nr:MAG: hypothetical protein DLM65_15330 [Candidatus Dormibacter sp. RRmetagenome_bin12]
MHETRLTFLAAAAEARTALVHADVEARWDAPSALAEMTIGELAAHLARAVITVQTYLRNPVSKTEEPMSAVSYYAAMEGLSDVASPLNAGVRKRAAEGARAGCRDVIESFDGSLAELHHALTTEPDDRLVEMIGNRVLPLDECLLSRVLELTVHTDDLWVSIGRPTPALTGMQPTIRLLVDIAEMRHGELAVLRALSRRERDPGDALRVL